MKEIAERIAETVTSLLIDCELLDERLEHLKPAKPIPDGSFSRNHRANGRTFAVVSAYLPGALENQSVDLKSSLGHLIDGCEQYAKARAKLTDQEWEILNGRFGRHVTASS